MKSSLRRRRFWKTTISISSIRRPNQTPIPYALRRSLHERSTAKRKACCSLRADGVLRLECDLVVGMGSGGGVGLGHQQRFLHSEKYGSVLIHFGPPDIHRDHD